MRILQAVHGFPPRATAGVEVYTSRLARELQARGHEVLVLSAVHDLDAEPAAAREREEDGVAVTEVVSVHARGTLEATYDDPEIGAAVAEVIARFRPDAVHVQHLLNLASPVVSAARAAGARVVMTLHDYWLSCPRDGLRMQADLTLCGVMDHGVCARCLKDSPYLAPQLQRSLAGMARRAGLGRQLHRLHDAAPRATELALEMLRGASPAAPVSLAAAMDLRAERLRELCGEIDAFIAPTTFAAERAIEFGAPRERVRVLGYGAVSGPAQPRRSGPRRRFGFVGSVAPHKGVHVLVEAFRGVPDSDLRLEIYGSLSVAPSYAERLSELAAGDERISFRGGFPEGGQAAAHASFDALVVPSLWWENSPITALEAIHAGLPVVASATGGVAEIVPEGAGLLVAPDNVAELRQALADVAAGRRLGDAAGPFQIKTVEQGASELLALYAR